MNDVETSASGDTMYLTPRAFHALKVDGCPHCKAAFIEREHPQFGGAFWGCPHHCRNASGQPVSLAWTPVSKRKKALRHTHPYKGSGY